MPDINSIPASASLQNRSRRASQLQASDALESSLNILPSNQSAVNPSASPSSSHIHASQSSPPLPLNPPQLDAEIVSGPGPLRHPRPLTASELHMQLEKEQEAVVNRLTRELSLLRAAHNASVVSNASSTSATQSNQDVITDASYRSGGGFAIPTAGRHRRTSSSTSQNPLSSSYDARTQAAMPTRPLSISRQNSTASRRSQNNGSPIPSAGLDPSQYFHQQRIPPPTSIPMTAQGSNHHVSEQLSPGMMPATLRYEETQHFKGELEAAKRENEVLKKRIRELEKQVQEGKAGETGPARRESFSTTASMNVVPSTGTSVAAPRESSSSRTERGRGLTSHSVASDAVGVPEEEVKVGESAASSGLP
ncbi:unnamed protein product [Clonostachys solani]|uniref:Uncharacterized protein n=1 Tax=Clonostachys solani TaxID=160281 RepID=A0A9N9ZCV6_9HYPO|nr:unnamed protein product [Clonostachys solani]